MKVNLERKFAQFGDHWSPRIVAECNDQYIKIARVSGEFVWHSHAEEDELFHILSGTLYLEFEDKTVQLEAGELLVVPQGVRHRPYTKNDEEVQLLLFEPKATKHTGTTESALTQKEDIFI